MKHGLLQRMRSWLRLDVNQGIIESNPLSVFALDRQYRYLAFNSAHARAMRALYAAEIKLGHSLFEYQTIDADSATARQNLDRSLAGEVVTAQAVSGDPTRQQAYFEVVHYPLKNRIGHIYGVAVVVKDITKQHAAEEETQTHLKRFNAAQRVGKVGSWEYHIQSGEVWGSEEGIRIYGLEPVDGDYPIDLIESRIPDREKVHQALVDLLSEGKPYDLEYVIKPFGSSEPKTITSVAELVCDESGHPLKVVGVIQDVTEQRKAEQEMRQSEIRLRRALMDAPFPTIIHAEDGEVVLVNTVWTEITGYQADEIATIEAWTQKAYGEGKEIVNKTIEQLFEVDQKVDQGEFTIKIKDGSTRVWEFSSTPLGALPDGRRVILSMANDVTIRKQAEKEIAETSLELEKRVHERTRALEAANDELASFVYSVSHDLRAPLRAVDGYSYLILNDKNNALSEKSLDYLQRIRDNAHTLSDIIDDLLSLSRTDREPLHEAAVDLDKLVRQVVAETQPDIEGHLFEVNYHDLPVCLGDAGLLRQVLINLLSNAFKFTRKVEPARIDIGCTLTEDAYVIYVKDNGVGFDMAYAGRLFGVFERLHSTTEYEGTGIGLAIVKNIIEKHGGRVWVEASVNNGAAFFFTLKRLPE